jgi:hypothetical protein
VYNAADTFDFTYYGFNSASWSFKPAGQHGAEIRWAMRDTHMPLTFEFDESDRGKTVYFCLGWENTRGEKGPWSEIQSAIVP